MSITYKGTGFRYGQEELRELEVTVEMYKGATVWNFDIGAYTAWRSDDREYEGMGSIGMSTAEVTRLRDQLNLFIEHERKHREAKYGNECGDHVVNEVMENMFTISLEEEVEFAGRRQVTDNVKKLIKEREIK